MSRTAANMLLDAAFVQKQEMKAAEPVSLDSSIPKISFDDPPSSRGARPAPRFKTIDASHRPTPIAQAIAMKSEPPPESTPVEIDQRIDRLLAEVLALTSERALLRKNMISTHERANQLLAEARKAKKLARACIAAAGNDDIEWPEFQALAAWAAEVL